MLTTVVDATAQMGPAVWTIVASLFISVGALFSLNFYDSTKRSVSGDQLIAISSAATCSAGLLFWLRL